MPRYYIQLERETFWQGEVIIEAESEAKAREEVEDMKARPDKSVIQWEIQTDEVTTTDVEELEE